MFQLKMNETINYVTVTILVKKQWTRERARVETRYSFPSFKLLII